MLPKKSPTVSVLMSVCNSDRYLAPAVESILNQTFADFEFLIVDDGSTDSSLQVLTQYAATDKRIRLTSHPLKGIPKTRNEMLTQATGDFIAVMDADDIAPPTRLASQVEFLQQHPEVVWLSGAFELIDEKGRFLTRITMPESNSEIHSLLMDGHTSFIHPGAMMPRSSLIAVGGYNEAMVTSCDLDLWLRLSEIGDLANLSEVVVRYRLHTSSISSQKHALQAQEVAAAFDRSWQRRGLQRQFQVTGCGWRPTHDPASRHQFMLQYGWWAFYSYQRRMAMEYALRAIAIKPFQIEGWNLLMCAAIKPVEDE
ncbi:glycosyltransferase [Leptolyngbya sp. FACHB-36]|uniref:glycosyltransferase family 2 protein n=1 Tax=Leptolyngbya sp. FACHB-36 TaxID=2692808 RepID=UPI0016802DCD|nr:glycosyltransferase [Leptolyngbya sp. FACHB-36]MBD2022175.1 glycosyltransferase [Leptolyngbya sp. FACHB-36]